MSGDAPFQGCGPRLVDSDLLRVSSRTRKISNAQTRSA